MKTIFAFCFLLSALVAGAQPWADVTLAQPLEVAGEAPPGYTAYAVQFDGSNDAITNANAQTGLSDGYEFTFAGWLYPDSTGAAQTIQTITTSALYRFLIFRLTDGRLRFLARSSGGTTKTDTFTVSALPASEWTHLLVCISRTAPLTNVYFNGTLTAITNGTWTGNDGNQNDWTSDRYHFGAQGVDMANKWAGRMSEVAWHTTIVNDPTKFIEGGAPKDLGAGGSTAFGVSPIFYFRGQANAWATNYGSGGSDFTVVGSLDAATPPP